MTSPDPHTDPGVSIARVPACVLCVGKQDEIERLRAALSALLEAIDRENKPPYPVLPLEVYEQARNALGEVDHDQP